MTRRRRILLGEAAIRSRQRRTFCIVACVVIALLFLTTLVTPPIDPGGDAAPAEMSASR